MSFYHIQHGVLIVSLTPLTHMQNICNTIIPWELQHKLNYFQKCNFIYLFILQNIVYSQRKKNFNEGKGRNPFGGNILFWDMESSGWIH